MNIHSVVFMGDIIGIFTSEKRAASRAKQIIYHYFDNPDKAWESFLKEGYDYTDEFEFDLRLVCDTVDTDEEEFSL